MPMLEVKMKWTGGIKFEGLSRFGHPIATDGSEEAGGGRNGYQPVELLLFGLAGCTGVDVVKILGKMRQEITGVEIVVRGYQPDQYPKAFNKIEIKYTFRGHGLDRNKIERAIKLSEDKYCAISLSLKGVAEIISSYEVIED